MNTMLWWFAQNTITVAAMIPIVMLACHWFRHRPTVQHLLWVLLLLKFLTPPMISWPWTAKQACQSISALASLDDGGVEHLTGLVVIQNEPVYLSRLSLSDDYVEGSTNSASTLTLPATQASSSTSAAMESFVHFARPTIAFLWLIGAATCLTYQVRRIVRHALLVRRSSKETELLAQEIRAIAERLGMSPPRARIARDILSPFMWCFGKLQLIWPETLASKSDVIRSRGVIAHELAHVRRRDHWVAWLELVAGIVWWWNPLYWFVRRRLRESAEMACDALAIATIPEHRRDYAEMLLELSAGFKTGTPAPVLAVSAGTPSSFERRLTMIVCDRVSSKHSLWGILTAGVLACVLLPGWSIGQQQQEPQQQQQQKPPDAELKKSLVVFDDVSLKLLESIVVAQQSQGEGNATVDEFEDISRKILESIAVAQQPQGEGRAAIDDVVFPKKWKETLLKELPATCTEGLTGDAAVTWKGCMKCHVANPNDKPKTIDKSLKSWGEKRVISPEAQKPITARRYRLIPQYKVEFDELPSVRSRRPSKDSDAPKTIEFKEKNRIYALSFDAKGGTLVASSADEGQVFWKTLFSESLPDRPTDDKWTLEESSDGKILMLSCTRKDGWLNYQFESNTGKIVHVQRVGSPQGGVNILPAKGATDDTSEVTSELQVKKQPTAISPQAESSRASEDYLEQRLSRAIAATNNTTSVSTLDLADRYLRAIADLKKAHGRLDRIRQAGEAISQTEKDEAQVEFERAEKQEQFIALYIDDSIKAAKAAQAAAESDFGRIEKLHQKGFIASTDFETAKSKLHEAAARVNQLENIAALKK